MRRLHLALFAEGPSDRHFLRPLLRRLAEDLCRRRWREDIEVADPLSLTSPGPDTTAPRENRIFQATAESAAAIDVLFIHTDGAGDPAAAHAQRVAPATQRILNEAVLDRIRPVAVIPVRETEAWCLVDGETVRAVTRCKVSDDAMGLGARPAEVERRPDPKADLKAVLAAALGPEPARKLQLDWLREQFGERLPLDRLRRVPSFQECENELAAALADLRFIG